MKTRTFIATGLLVALLVAAVVSFYASSNPDGLEYVADETEFLDSAEEHATAGSPLADYGTEGVDNERLSVGIAGIVGSLATLLAMTGIVYVVRRRASANETNDSVTPATTGS